MKIRSLMLGFVILPGMASACINDRDTLAFEKRNVDAVARVTNEKDPDKKAKVVQEIVLRAIGGRFDRFPPRYYEMRIARLEAKPTLTAQEYDDLAVAYDRLGQVDRAISIILDSQKSRKSADDQYRFHANYGTFLVHRWILNGQKPTEIKTLDQSIAEIEAALKINPSSHFGREAVQLKLQQFWHYSALGKPRKPIEWHFGNSWTKQETQVGLAGLIMMGLAYELPDAYIALSAAPHLGHVKSRLPEFAWLRNRELKEAGISTVGDFSTYNLIHHDAEFSGASMAEYQGLRQDGDDVYHRRLAYMNSRFAMGQHPDTDPDFWNDWQEPPYPVLKVVPDSSVMITPIGRLTPTIVNAAIALGAIFLTSVTAAIFWRRRRRLR